MSATRVNPYPMPDLLDALERLSQERDTATLQMATGSRINRPSDDPAGAAEVVRIHDTGSRMDSFQRTIGSVTGQLSTADSTLSSVVSALQRAVTLGTEGANGTLSDSDRAAVAAEVTGIQSQLLSLANASYQGRFIFDGTAGRQPFVDDPNSASGVTYQGNDGTNQVAIGSGYTLQVNVPGSQIFQGVSDVFQSIHDLITALQTNTNIPAAVDSVASASRYIGVQRVFYGNALNQLTSQGTYLNSAQAELAQQGADVAGADMATLATDFTANQTASNATMAAMGRLSQMSSLFDYLK